LQQLTASDGAEIGYTDEGGGRPLVLLHGLMAHGGFFRLQRELLDSFRLIALDFRGHGRTQAASGGASVARLAADVEELAEKLDLRGAIGIGWSLGAAILWRVLAGSAGDRFAGSVTIDMAPRVRNEDDWQLGISAELCDARTAAIRDDYSDFAVAAGHAIFSQPLVDGTRELAEWSSFEFAKNDPAAIDAVWTSLVADDFRNDLPLISQPSLIVHGLKSQLYGPATARYLERSLQRACAVPFEGSGHAPHLEEPKKFNDLIREFAASLPAPRKAHATA
jgi:pimeloyl-[acyl-carrier protein] methyl ester esterase